MQIGHNLFGLPYDGSNLIIERTPTDLDDIIDEVWDFSSLVKKWQLIQGLYGDVAMRLSGRTHVI